MEMNSSEIKIIAKFLGYNFVEKDVIIGTNSKINVYSKTPIEVEEISYPGEIDEQVIEDLGGKEYITQKFFKQVPNPDFGRSEDDEIQDGHVPIKFEPSATTVGWEQVNEYVTDDFFSKLKTDMHAQLTFLETQACEKYQLVLNNEKVAIFAKEGSHFIAAYESNWVHGLWKVISKYIVYINELERLKEVAQN